MNYKADLIDLYNTLQDVNSSIGGLKDFLTLSPETNECFKYAETLNERLERAVISSRNLVESLITGVEPTRIKKPSLPAMGIAGNISVTEEGWLHIQLNTLLPHCRYKTPMYLTETLTLLLNGMYTKRGELPFYKSAMLIIDEHCNIKSRRVYDQDNKGYKAVSNALKGRVFPDDDQFTMGLSLISTQDETKVCDIHVIGASDAGVFFSRRTIESA